MNRPTDGPLVLVAGAASRDIASDDPRGWRLGGAVTYASLMLARLGLRVGSVIGVDAEAASARELVAIESAGAIVVRVPLAAGPVFEIRDTAEGRRIRCISASDPLAVTDVPRAWLRQGTPAFLGPVAAELGAEWAAVGGDELALGWQGILRRLAPGDDVSRLPPDRHPLLDVATLVGLSREDVSADVAVADLAGLLRPGATLVCTDGERGGELVPLGDDGARAASWRYTALPSDHVVDPTGAGDVFLAAMLAARLDPSLGPEVAVAAAAASLVVEATGVDGVPTRAAVLERMRRPESRANR